VVLILAAAACMPAIPARASFADYSAARKSNPPVPASATSVILRNPSAFDGRVVEIVGAVSGLSVSGETLCLLIKSSEGQTTVLQGSAGGDTPAMGSAVRALARASVTGRFDLIAVVAESEVPPAPAPKPAASGRPAPPTRTPKQPAVAPNRSTVVSRGGIDLSAYVPIYARVVRTINKRLSEAEANRIARSIIAFSWENGIDGRLVMAIVATESGFRPGATSRAGAMGLSQLMPGTARGLGVRNGYDIEQNIAGATKLLRSHINKYASKGDDWFKLVCAAYNAGPNAVRKYGGVPPYRETQAYVRKVNAWYRIFAPELYQK
jgi:soluble lytic murein transglycosylase-like protein